MLFASVSVTRRVTGKVGPVDLLVSFKNEVLAVQDDHDAVLERVSELFELAEEALDRHIDGGPQDSEPASKPIVPSPAPRQQSPSDTRPQYPATEKQVAFVRNLSKRLHLSGDELAAQTIAVLGRPIPVEQLDKRQAARTADVPATRKIVSVDLFAFATPAGCAAVVG